MRPWNQPTALLLGQRVAPSCRSGRLRRARANRAPASSAAARCRPASNSGRDRRRPCRRAPFGSARLAFEEVLGRKRRADRAAGVARRRLNPDVRRRCRRAAPCRWRRNSAPRRRQGRGSRSGLFGERCASAAAPPLPAPPGSRRDIHVERGQQLRPGCAPAAPNNRRTARWSCVRPVQ